MKLKGKNSKRLKPKQKAKMEKTLKRMEETRQKDSINLRDTLVERLAWAKAEKAKGTTLIERTKIQIYRLEGVILFIDEILNPKDK